MSLSVFVVSLIGPRAAWEDGVSKKDCPDPSVSMYARNCLVVQWFVRAQGTRGLSHSWEVGLGCEIKSVGSTSLSFLLQVAA